VRIRWHDPLRVCARVLVAGGSALIPAVAAGQVADSGVTSDDRVAIRIDYSAPAGCPSADDFEAEVRARTARARRAVASEPARIFHVAILEEGNAAVGRMIVDRDGGSSGARVLRGRSCSDVSSALALTAALSIDPTARLVLEPAPEPAPVAPVTPEPVPRPRPARPLVREPSNVGFGLGASAGLAQIVAPGLMPVTSVLGELAFPGRGALSPAVRVSVNVASNTLDTGRDATFTWVAGGLDLCPLRAVLGRSLELRPCLAAQGGWLHGVGRNVAEPLSASRAWGSAGASVQLAARLSSRVAIQVSGSALLPLRPLHFDFELPSREVARTPTLSVGVGLSAFVYFL